MNAREASLYSNVITNGFNVYAKCDNDLWYKFGSDVPYGIGELQGTFVSMQSMISTMVTEKDKWKIKETGYGYATHAPVEPIKEKEVNDCMKLNIFVVFDSDGDRGFGGTVDDAIADYQENIGGTKPTKTVHIVLNVPKESFVPKLNVKLNETHEVKITDLVE